MPSGKKAFEWKGHVAPTDPDDARKSTFKGACNYCDRVFTCNATRVLDHLAGTGNVAACDKLPDSLAQEMRVLAAQKVQKKEKKKRLQALQEEVDEAGLAGRTGASSGSGPSLPRRLFASPSKSPHHKKPKVGVRFEPHTQWLCSC